MSVLLTVVPEENPPIFRSLVLENDKSFRNRWFWNNCTDYDNALPVCNNIHLFEARKFDLLRNVRHLGEKSGFYTGITI